MAIVNKMAACIVEVMKSPKASGAGRPDFRSIAQTRSRKHANCDTPFCTSATAGLRESDKLRVDGLYTVYTQLIDIRRCNL